MTAHARPAFSEALDRAQLRVGVICTRWNSEIVDRLAAGVDHELDRSHIQARIDITVAGCLELPLAAKLLAESGRVDAIVCIGAVVRGETTHYELVSNGCASGLLRVQLDVGLPIGFGILTVENLDQARARSEAPPGANVGADATDAALDLALLAPKLAALAANLGARTSPTTTRRQNWLPWQPI